ncbi:hypothetical protein NDU88_000250 [Pleurodeles waltl]|uniref:Uncharacterized protein n=1 Tax=Pleurodeles waltl TaxID=8319 RepID=A0AAV7URA8_PLEWA|nr:hypothetical protein NDU88_000250 [Pleurodeles waltl]
MSLIFAIMFNNGSRLLGRLPTSTKPFLSDSRGDKSIPNVESIRDKVVESQAKAKCRYDDLKKVREVDFEIGDRVKVEGGKGWSKRKVAKVDKVVDAQRIQLGDKVSGEVSGGLMSEVCIGDGTFRMEERNVGICGVGLGETWLVSKTVAEELEESSVLVQVCDNEEVTEEANIMVVSENSICGCKEMGEKVQGEFQKSRRVINKPRCLEDYVLV